MVNGWEKIDMEKESNLGQMEPNMMVNGNIIKLMEEEYFVMLTKLNMKDNGNTVKHMAMEL